MEETYRWFELKRLLHRAYGVYLQMISDRSRPDSECVAIELQMQILRLLMPPRPDVEAESIDCLQLSVRAYKRLKECGIETIGQLCSRSKDELMAIPGFGRGCLDEVVKDLAVIDIYVGR